jgi:hypothetical protein
VVAKVLRNNSEFEVGVNNLKQISKFDIEKACNIVVDNSVRTQKNQF